MLSPLSIRDQLGWRLPDGLAVSTIKRLLNRDNSYKDRLNCDNSHKDRDASDLCDALGLTSVQLATTIKSSPAIFSMGMYPGCVGLSVFSLETKWREQIRSPAAVCQADLSMFTLRMASDQHPRFSRSWWTQYSEWWNKQDWSVSCTTQMITFLWKCPTSRRQPSGDSNQDDIQAWHSIGLRESGGPKHQVHLLGDRVGQWSMSARLPEDKLESSRTWLHHVRTRRPVQKWNCCL